MTAHVVNQPQFTDWNINGTSSANAAQTLTLTPPGGAMAIAISGLTISWTGGAPSSANNVQIKDGTTVIWDAYYGSAAGAPQSVNDYEFTQPLKITPGNTLTIVVAAAGSGITTKLTAQGLYLIGN